MAKYDIEQEVEYLSTDSKGVESWAKGTVTAVRTIEHQDDTQNEITYILSVGKGKKIGERPLDVREIEIGKRRDKMVAEGMDIKEAGEKAVKSKNLPESKKVIEPVMEYKTIEVSAENIRAIE